MSSGTESTMVLDRVEGYSWASSLVSKFYNDFEKRDSLWAGLELHYQQTRELEKRFAPKSEPKLVEMSWGNIPGIPVRLLRQVSCFFDWYSVSASSFVMLTGWLLEQGGQLVKGEKYDYRRRVIPAVTKHRNKIGAHPSRFNPKKDVRPVQEMSCIRNIGLVCGRWTANCMVLGIRDKSGISDSSELAAWSLTESHEALRERYAESGPKEDDAESQMRESGR